MDPVKKDSSKTDFSGSDADVSFLLYKIGHAVKRFFILIGQGLAGIGAGMLAALLFLLRNIIWILIGIVISVSYGVYKMSKTGPRYTSDITVKANFGSSRTLYYSVDYLNSLVGTGGTKQLSDLFGISEKEASHLLGFSIKPVRSEIIVSDLYREQFMEYDRTSKVRLDTFWTRTITYEDFKESLTNFDFPYYVITVEATQPDIFSHLEKGIVMHVSKNELLLEIKQQQALSNQDEEKLIVNAIRNLDSLRQAYNQRISKSTTDGTSGNQVTLLQTAPELKTPELDLYDKMLELQAELKKARKRAVTEQDIIEIHSPFAPIGKPTPIFSNLMTFVLIGFGIAVLILTAIALYKFLTAVEASRKRGKSLKTS
jgi:hypothetical protein